MLICIQGELSPRRYMAQQKLLSSFGKRGVNMGLNTMKVDIEDTTYLSKYFNISEFSPVFTAGKIPISFNGSSLLANGSEIKVECLDSNNNSLYIEFPQGNIQYTDVAKFLLSINIFNETYNGPGKLIFVGTTANNEIVRWKTNIAIDKTLQNSSKVRFYNKPSLEVRGLLYPVVTNNTAVNLTNTILFTGSFLAYPITPPKDTNRNKIDLKNMDVDYRISINSNGGGNGSTLSPTCSFNSQMDGQPINITANHVQLPFSYTDTAVQNTTSPFTIKKVLNSTTLQLSDAFFYSNGQNQYVTSINLGAFTSSYTFISYNTGSDVYFRRDPTDETSQLIKKSYAEVVYRNIEPFSGFVARHKLYRNSMAYPGGYELIVDESLGASELLVDPITPNQTYPYTGNFYNQFHIDKYWFASSTDIFLSHSISPFINAMRINKPASSFNSVDGRNYVIAKVNSPNTPGNAIYYPFDPTSYDDLQGDSYNSNFISLKAGSLYVLSFNLEVEKDKKNTDSNISFYFTSSVPSIQFEKGYSNTFGLFLGSVTTSDYVATKIYADKQYLYFTPSNDYYGTLLIVPYHCVPTISELSVQVYGDYGFSPDVLFTKIPFPLNLPNESYQLKSELFDINSTLIYSNLTTMGTFDPNGESLISLAPDPAKVTFISASLTLSQSLYLPNINGCPQNGTRLLSWHSPLLSPPTATDGEICFTDVSNLGIFNNDYVGIQTTNGVLNSYASALSVRFTGSEAPGGGGGRRIYVDSVGSKYLQP